MSGHTITPLAWHPTGALAAGRRRLTRTLWRVRLCDRDGAEGWGEAAPIAGFGAGPERVAAQQATAATHLEAACAVAATPHDIGAWASALPLAPEWQAALSTAALALAARRAGCAPAALLAARPAARVRVAAVVADADAALAAARAGYSAVKLKLGRADWRDDVRQVACIRDAVDATVELRLDVNGGWTLATARCALPLLAAHAVAWIEEPVAPRAWDELARLRRYQVPIALDESLADRADVVAAAAAAAADVAVIKPALVGGPFAGLALARAAANAGLRVVFSHAADSVIGREMALNVAAAWGQGTHGVYWHEAPDAAAAPPVNAGWVRVPELQTVAA